jgi:hypothetical protein
MELDPAARPRPATDGRWTCRSRSSPSWRPCCTPALHASPAFLSAEDLLEKAWDEQADPLTTTVNVTISRLRRKLGDPPVTTTPGVGRVE